MHDAAQKDDDKILEIRIEDQPGPATKAPSSTTPSPQAATGNALAVSKHRQVNHAFYFFLVAGIAAEFLRVWPVAYGCILVYCGLGLTLNKSERNSEKFADSLYYMGFILTIWALIFSLQPWKETTAGLTSAQILPLFGVALVSTALGMTLRIILIQNRNTVFDQEEQARETIDQHIGIMIEEMQRSATLLRSTNQTLAARGDELVTTLRQQLIDANADTTKQLAALVDTCKTKVQEQLGQLGPAIEEAKTKLQAVEIPNDLVRAAFNDSIVALKGEMARLEREMAAASSGFTKAIEKGAGELQTSLGSITEISARLSRTKSALSRFTELMEKIAVGAEKTTEAGTKIAEAAEEAAKRLNTTAGVSAQAVERVASSTVNLTRVIEGAQHTIAQDTTRYGENLKRSSETLTSQIQVTGQNVAKFEESMDKTVTFIKTTLSEPTTS